MLLEINRSKELWKKSPLDANDLIFQMYCNDSRYVLSKKDQFTLTGDGYTLGRFLLLFFFLLFCCCCFFVFFFVLFCLFFSPFFQVTLNCVFFFPVFIYFVSGFLNIF